MIEFHIESKPWLSVRRMRCELSAKRTSRRMLCSLEKKPFFGGQVKSRLRPNVPSVQATDSSSCDNITTFGIRSPIETLTNEQIFKTTCPTEHASFTAATRSQKYRIFYRIRFSIIHRNPPQKLITRIMHYYIIHHVKNGKVRPCDILM